MTRHRGLPILDILEIKKDNIGGYVKINAMLVDGEIVIRCGVDDFTFQHLRKATQTRCFDTMPGLKYEYHLLIMYSSSNRNAEKPEYSGFVECILDSQTKDIEFKCSSFMASNIEWFRSIKSINDLEFLRWNNS